MRYMLCAVPAAAALTVPAHAGGPVIPASTITITESFDSGLGAWTPDWFINCTDCTQPFHPEFNLVTTPAHTGARAVRTVANGLNDDGTLWLERSVSLPAGTYQCALAFWKWSDSDADIGTWVKVGYIGQANPETEEDFASIDSTEYAGWHEFTHSATVTLAQPGQVWFAFGLNIVFESWRTDFFDDVTITVTPGPAGCNRADLAGPGGTPIPDGQLTADDVVAFLSAFFASDPHADLASLGGAPTPDGAITADDLVVFLQSFFAGCP